MRYVREIINFSGQETWDLGSKCQILNTKSEMLAVCVIEVIEAL